VQGVFSINAFRISPDRLGVAFEDVTERVRGEDALRASEMKYRMLTETMKDVVWVLDTASLRFLYVSPSVEKLRGFTVAEIMSRPLDDALSGEQRELIRGLIRERCDALERGELDDDNYFVEEVAQPCKDGSIVWTEVVTRFWKNTESGGIEIHGVTRDITERRRNREKISSLLAEKELLLRETHHRIKNNMSVIRSLLLMQSMRPDNHAVTGVFEDAAGRVQSMLVLYDTLYSNNDGAFAEARDFIPRLAADVAALYAGIQPVRLVTDIVECPLPAKTMSALGIIINELVTNSLKHAFSGNPDPQIHISLHHAGDMLEMVFRDNGTGLGAQNMETGHGFGMQLITMLASQIGATVRMENKNGLWCVLRFSANNE
jgi:PAS domain S-box-containing protein